MIQKKTRQQMMDELSSKFARAQQDFRARNAQLQQAAAQRPSSQFAPRRPSRASFGMQQKPVEAPVNRNPAISVGVPGTPTYREKIMDQPGGKAETPQGLPSISVGVRGTPTFREQPMAAPNKISPVGPPAPNPYVTYRGNGMASMASPPSEAKRRIDDEFNRLTANGTRPFPGGTEGFLKFQKEQEMQRPSSPFGISVGVPGTPTYREQPVVPPGKAETPQGPFGISVGVPGTPTYGFKEMSPPGAKVETSQPALGRSVGVPGTDTYREQPLTMATKGPAPAFKKGGKVKAKVTPIKKAAGGKVAAKAPVKKTMGGKVAAKPVAKKAKPMSAMKRGGKVMMKGKYK